MDKLSIQTYPNYRETVLLKSMKIENLKFDREAIYYGCSSENARIGGGYWSFGDFIELSFCFPC